MALTVDSNFKEGSNLLMINMLGQYKKIQGLWFMKEV